MSDHVSLLQLYSPSSPRLLQLMLARKNMQGTKKKGHTYNSRFSGKIRPLPWALDKPGLLHKQPPSPQTTGKPVWPAVANKSPKRKAGYANHMSQWRDGKIHCIIGSSAIWFIVDLTVFMAHTCSLQWSHYMHMYECMHSMHLSMSLGSHMYSMWWIHGVYATT